NIVLAVLLGAGIALVTALHLLAGAKGRAVDRAVAGAERDGFVEVCAVDNIPERRAKVVSLGTERVAVFRYDGKVSAISNVCRHQNGPLGEGRIIDGCVTCPWHGYQYLPETGGSPPPFTEKVSTFQTKIVDGRVCIDPKPTAHGTRVEPSRTSDVGART